MSEKILTTGKCLNVIRECGISIDRDSKEKLEYSADEQVYHQKIEKAFQVANSKLLKLLYEDFKFSEVLRSFKHYFLMDQGDFYLHLMDAIHDELRKPANEVQVNRLNSLLELSLRTSSLENDPHQDNLSCVMLPHRLGDQLIHMVQIKASGSPADIPVSSSPLPQDYKGMLYCI
jgi:gamma-tubulin complex component 2